MFVKFVLEKTSTTTKWLKFTLQLKATMFFFDTFGISVIISIYLFLQTFDHFVVI